MRIRISAPDRPAEYAALWNWLRTERELAGRTRAIQRPPGPEELGDGIDLIALAVSSLSVLIALAQTIPGYLSTRRSQIRLHLRRADGAELELDSDTDIDKVASLVQVFLRDGFDDE
ncbi:effector-associated constant component EACC1 [Acrocarpospora macrocephala]|uniref:effector-associated constant component EACC1 n=1 Tax=Acrocarpospora macrocephala TaxID=150177 RepID=UPI0012D2BA50|nr:hypothetical protein [Acrocarpospora macrocephala]